MSYPPVRYQGDDGERGLATFRPASAPPDLAQPSGGGAAYLASSALTGGDYGLFRWDMPASPSGPAPHFHRTMSEAFFVLSGTIRLHDGQRWLDGTAGDYLYVPEGGIHGFRNESGEPASMLILFAPGAPREDYFERVATTGQMPEEERTEFYLRHDTFWT